MQDDRDMYGTLETRAADAIPLSPTSLAAADRSSKLMIVTHGSESGPGGIFMKMLAVKLKDAGLKEVGLISFKSCFMGNDEFLDYFSLYLSKNLGIDHGWLIAYRGEITTLKSRFGVAWHMSLVTYEDIFFHRHEHKDSDSARIRLVKGNIDVILPGSRRFSSPAQLCNLRRRLT